MIPRDKLEELKKQINTNCSSNGAEAYRLLNVCRDLDITTTHAALVQLIIREKSKHHLKPIPISKEEISLQVIDALIYSLEDLRDYISAVVLENRKLKERLKLLE